MKHLSITYHMTKPGEIAETCITLPMEEKIADEILEKGDRSIHLEAAANGEVYRALRSISSIQGYEYAGFCCAEHDNFWKEIEK